MEPQGVLAGVTEAAQRAETAAPAVAAAERLACLRLQMSPLSPRQRALVLQAGQGRAEAGLRHVLEGRLAGVVPNEATVALHWIDESAVEEETARADALGLTVLTRADPCYPNGLEALVDPPLAVWVRGRLPAAEAVAVAIVGARRATSYGLQVARSLAGGLAEAGVLVVSGGARGVDGAAHVAALEARAATLAVLGCGLDITYPREHGRLFDLIAGSGALLSEHPLGTPPRAHHFPARNWLLAALSRAIVVVEATARSGSLITARLGLEMGRDVLAVPGNVTSPASEGTNELLARGARPARGPRDVLEELGDAALVALALTRAAPGTGGADAVAKAPGGGLPAESRAVLAALPAGEAVPLDVLAGRLSWPAGLLLARLLALEARGLVVRLPGGAHARV